MDTNHQDDRRELTVAEPRAVTAPVPQDAYLPVAEIVQRLNLVRELRDTVMVEDVHFGVIPGTEKPTLYQAGADMLRMMFNLQPAYHIMRDEDIANPHRGYMVHTTLTHALTGAVWGQGIGSCSTMESKYRWRYAKRTCPTCGVDAIAKGKEEYGGGWYCNKRSGGCGAKFHATAAAIMRQEVGRIENPDLADQFNTVLKLAKKRSFVDAILNATGAREKFSNVTETTEQEEDDDLPSVEESRVAVQPQPSKQPATVQQREYKPLFVALGKQKISDAQFRKYLTARFERLQGQEDPSTKNLTDDEFTAVLNEVENGAVKQFLAMPEGRQEK